LFTGPAISYKSGIDVAHKAALGMFLVSVTDRTTVNRAVSGTSADKTQGREQNEQDVRDAT